MWKEKGGEVLESPREESQKKRRQKHKCTETIKVKSIHKCIFWYWRVPPRVVVAFGGRGTVVFGACFTARDMSQRNVHDWGPDWVPALFVKTQCSGAN